MRLACGFTVAVLAMSCASPLYKSGDLRCSPTGQCPEGFHCAADKRCWLAGSGPEAGVAHDLALSPADLTSATLPDLAGVDQGAATVCPTSVLLCDGFESATLDSQWRIVGGGASAALDKTRAFRGTQSVHVHSDSAAAGTDPNAGLSETRTFPIAGTAWVRAWIYFQSPYSGNFNQVINFVDASGGGASYAVKNAAPVNNDYGGGGYRESTLPIPMDKWTCLRISLGQGAGTGDIHLYVDDAEAADAQLLGATVTTMTRLYLGVDFFGNAAMGSTDLWIDDVIVDNKMIKCSD